MAYKIAWIAMTLAVTALAGCTAGSDDGGSGDGNSTSGGVGVGGTVSGPGGGVGGNATVSGTSTMTGTNGTGNGSEEANMTADVSLEGGKFVPSTVTIAVGGTVTWTHNDGANPHTVTADDAAYDSHPNCNPPLTAIGDCMSAGETFTYTFTTAGEFGYHDKVNAQMTGTVRVVEA